MKKCRVAVIGAGYLGTFHAEKYANNSQAEIVAIIDTDKAKARQLASVYNVNAYSSVNDCVDNIDAASIVTVTAAHYDIAKQLLARAIPILIEKPITVTVDEADELIALAQQQQVIIQVGHLERYNSAIMTLRQQIDNPRFIESHRIAPFTPRGADVNVILDLMIHDIDLISYLVNADVVDIKANGAPVLSSAIDIANARIEFSNGTVANVTASRAGLKKERKMRLFQHDAYFSINLQDKSCQVYRKGKGEMFPGIPTIASEMLRFTDTDALQQEIDAFINAVVHCLPSPVSGEAGRDALAVAHKITHLIKDAQHDSNG